MDIWFVSGHSLGRQDDFRIDSAGENTLVLFAKSDSADSCVSPGARSTVPNSSPGLSSRVADDRLSREIYLIALARADDEADIARNHRRLAPRVTCKTRIGGHFPC